MLNYKGCPTDQLVPGDSQYLHPLPVIDTVAVPSRPEPQPWNSGQCNVGTGPTEPGPRVPRAQGLLSPVSIEFTPFRCGTFEVN